MSQYLPWLPRKLAERFSRILDHLGLGPPETAKPPPALPPVPIRAAEAFAYGSVAVRIFHWQ